jgi:hypothetical protein
LKKKSTEIMGENILNLVEDKTKDKERISKSAREK